MHWIQLTDYTDHEKFWINMDAIMSVGRRLIDEKGDYTELIPAGLKLSYRVKETPQEIMSIMQSANRPVQSVT